MGLGQYVDAMRWQPAAVAAMNLSGSVWATSGQDEDRTQFVRQLSLQQGMLSALTSDSDDSVSHLKDNVEYTLAMPEALATWSTCGCSVGHVQDSSEQLCWQ